jgi:hypothetical protein
MGGDLMPAARFVTAFDDTAGRPALPDGDMEGDGRGVFADGTPGYGWVTCSHTPGLPTCIVLVSSTQAVIDAMTASDDYQWIEDVA